MGLHLGGGGKHSSLGGRGGERARLGREKLTGGMGRIPVFPPPPSVYLVIVLAKVKNLAQNKNIFCSNCNT